MSDFWKLFQNVSIVVGVIAVSVGAGWIVGRDMLDLRHQMDERLQRVDSTLIALAKQSRIDTSSVPADPEKTRTEDAGTIRFDEPNRGALEENDATLIDGSYFDDWILILDSAETAFTIRMESNELDPFLFLSRGSRDSDDWEPIGYDDDGGGGWTASLTQDLTAGHYIITANTFGAATGRYTLLVNRSSVRD